MHNMPGNPIKFGTDGWRAKIGEEFTFANLAKVTDAYAKYVLKTDKKPKIAVGYDFRFLSEKYAEFVAERLKNYGFYIQLFDKAVPTPIVSFGVKRLKLNSGIMITSSHNPYVYNGFKIKNKYGAGISSQESGRIEKLLSDKRKIKQANGKIKKINLDKEYIELIRKFVDINAIRKSGIKIVLDNMYGSGKGYMEEILGYYENLYVIHNYRDPLFGKINPEPIKKNLLDLISIVKEEKADVGIAIDGDGDRMAAIDNDGEYITPHKVLVFHLLHHIRNKNMKPTFARTISGTFLLDKIAKINGLKVVETPVGFKNIADFLIKDKNTIGGEESGGIGFGYYVPERDGILSNLLFVEFIVKEGKKITDIMDNIDATYGTYKYDRIDTGFKEKDRKKIMAKVAAIRKKGSILGKKIIKVNLLDGIKCILGGNEWLLFRFSGTEPLLRIYSEAPTDKRVQELLKFGKNLVQR